MSSMDSSNFNLGAFGESHQPHSVLRNCSCWLRSIAKYSDSQPSMLGVGEWASLVSIRNGFDGVETISKKSCEMWNAGLLKRKTQNQLKHKLLNTASLVNYISSLESIIFSIMFILPFAIFQNPSGSRWSRRFVVGSKQKITSQHPTVECSVSVVAPQISWKQLQGPKSPHFFGGSKWICSCFMVFFVDSRFFFWKTFWRLFAVLEDVTLLSFFEKNGQKWAFQIRPSLRHCCTVAEVTHCSGWWWPSSPSLTNLHRKLTWPGKKQQSTTPSQWACKPNREN